MALRRGFKTEANTIAREIRAELALASIAPLDPWKLAKHLDIPVVGLSSFRTLAPSVVRQFAMVDPSEFSALTVFRGTRRLIVHNDFHTKGRQANDVAHELAHALLLHPPTPALDDKGCRNWNKDLEDEATWLSAALLISEEAALYIVRQELSTAVATETYGVSRKVLVMRIGVTGARQRVARAQRYYRNAPSK
jgi:Zn-dependent peptidase ImmA (M78 family)